MRIRNGLFTPLFIRSLWCCPVPEAHSSRLKVIAIRDRGDFSVLLLTREPDFKVIADTSREAYVSTTDVQRRTRRRRRRRMRTRREGDEEEKNVREEEEEKNVREKEGAEKEEEEEDMQRIAAMGG
jgi:hypothetical protein